MKKGLLSLFLFSIYMVSSAQCGSRRYLDTIFQAVSQSSGIYFGSSTAYSGLTQDLYLDLYEPAGDTLTQRPLIVYAFGGAFLIGTRYQPPIPAYCTYLAQCGYVVASIDYRIGFNVLSTGSAERAVYRASQDLRAAVRYLCQRYAQYRIDTTAIFLTGSSAGCFAGMHSCFMEPGDVPASVGGIPLENTNLGCFDCADNADNNRTMPHIRGIINHWGAILDTIYIRTTPKDRVPVISLAGDQDHLVPYVSGSPFGYPVFPTVYGSAAIHARMDDLGIKNELHPLYGYGHEPWLLAPQLLDTCFKYEKPFLYSILRPAPLVISGDTMICLGDTATYSVPMRPGSSYCWNYTGATLLHYGGHTITLRWTNAGPHLVTVREMSRNEVNGDIDSVIVNVVSRPRAVFGDTVMHNAVSFTDSSVAALSWYYSFGDGAYASTPNSTHTYRSQDTFTVRLVVSNRLCADTAYRSVITDTCPSLVDIHYTMSGDTVYLQAQPGGCLAYQWQFGDGDSMSGNFVYHLYTHDQNYLVSVWITTANGCHVYGSDILHPTSGMGELPGQGLTVYPNPVTNVLHIMSRADGRAYIFDMTGREVLTANIIAETISNVAINQLAKGPYLLKIQSKNGIVHKSVLKD